MDLMDFILVNEARVSKWEQTENKLFFFLDQTEFNRNFCSDFPLTSVMAPCLSSVTIISGIIMLILFVSELQYYLTKEVSSSSDRRLWD